MSFQFLFCLEFTFTAGVVARVRFLCFVNIGMKSYFHFCFEGLIADLAMERLYRRMSYDMLVQLAFALESTKVKKMSNQREF